MLASTAAASSSDPSSGSGVDGAKTGTYAGGLCAGGGGKLGKAESSADGNGRGLNLAGAKPEPAGAESVCEAAFGLRRPRPEAPAPTKLFPDIHELQSISSRPTHFFKFSLWPRER
jgi:hypothetical protein